MITLTIVIPAYNEELRLPAFLKNLISYLAGKRDLSYEILVVNDGSSDRTAQIAAAEIGQHGRVINLNRNLGKGACIKEGARQARGHFTCITDADGSASLEAFVDAVAILQNSHCWGLVGTRYIAKERKHVTMTTKRLYAGVLFASLTRIILGLRYSDTQCGFKVFHTSILNKILSVCKYKRFGIDFELLYVAKKNDIAFIEFPVSWLEMPGSKVKIFADGLQMTVDMLRLKLRNERTLKIEIPSAIVSSDTLEFSSVHHPNSNFYEDSDQNSKHSKTPKKAG